MMPQSIKIIFLFLLPIVETFRHAKEKEICGNADHCHSYSYMTKSQATKSNKIKIKGSNFITKSPSFPFPHSIHICTKMFD